MQLGANSQWVFQYVVIASVWAFGSTFKAISTKCEIACIMFSFLWPSSLYLEPRDYLWVHTFWAAPTCAKCCQALPERSKMPLCRSGEPGPVGEGAGGGVRGRRF